MKYSTKLHATNGQVLVFLLIFMVVSIIITSAATLLLFTNSTSTTRAEQGLLTYNIAESGMENALLRLLRNPFYTGETLSIDGGTATIVLSGTSTKTITSTGQQGNYVKKIQVIASYTNNVLTITSWKEIP